MAAPATTDAIQLLLQQFEGADPQLRQLLEQQLKNQMQSPGREEPTKEELLRRFRIQNKKLLEQVAASKSGLKEFREENTKLIGYLDYFLKLNQTLSAALGSCENCWGEDAECDQCGGRGSPGWRPSNPRLFQLYVQPCLDKRKSAGK